MVSLVYLHPLDHRVNHENYKHHPKYLYLYLYDQKDTSHIKYICDQIQIVCNL